MAKKKTMMSWSSGKDSAWAFYKLLQNPKIEVVGLFCTVNRKFKRVAMHGISIELLLQQAKRIGLPMELIEIPYPCNNEEYEKIMAQFVKKAKNNHIEYFAFGDLFLEDIRNYRAQKLYSCGIKPIFPIWGSSTDALAKEMINNGLKTIITCIDPKQIPQRFIGKEFNEIFLESLPKSVDPCGENGEFHSFVYDAPMFSKPIQVSVGEIIHRDNFIFADLIPVTAAPCR